MTAGIRIDRLSFAYDGEPVLDKLSCAFHAGDAHYLVGASGVGKTTVALLLAGILSPARGSIVRSPDIEPRLVLQFPEQLFLADSIADEWQLVRETGSQAQAAESMKQFGLSYDECAERSPRSLSFGQRRLLALALQSAHDTPHLILDEPTLGLDEENLAKVAAWIGDRVKGGAVCVVITHDVELLAALPGKVHILRGGRISWQGTSHDFLQFRELQVEAGFR